MVIFMGAMGKLRYTTSSRCSGDDLLLCTLYIHRDNGDEPLDPNARLDTNSPLLALSCPRLQRPLLLPLGLYKSLLVHP